MSVSRRCASCLRKVPKDAVYCSLACAHADRDALQKRQDANRDQ